MSWEDVLQIDPGADEPLRPRIDFLFAQQRATWPALREGEAALSQLQRKQLSSEGESIVVQLNPARRRSTLARTDAKAVAARACFLCPENMPAEERGVEFDDLVVLPNPYPILPLHCTIAGRGHKPQQLAGRVGTFLRLAESIGPDMVALYNGPRCGASAPDHFHLQATSADNIPILSQLARFDPKRFVTAHSSFGRNMLIFRGTNAAEVQANIKRAIAALGDIKDSTDEPMVNLLGHSQADGHTVVLFPRATHRPACYFATGSDKLSISPAVLEMCGLLVATEPEHFDRIDAATAKSIYEEVSLGAEEFDQLAALTRS
jgi:hypothetical protein